MPKTIGPNVEHRHTAKSGISPRRRLLLAVTCLIATPCAAAWLGAYVSYSKSIPQTEVYRGVYYRSIDGGRSHLIEVDLSCPGIGLYLTPLQADAALSGHEYRLDFVRNVARAEGLSIAVNGNMFESDSYIVPMVGDFANSRDTIVAEHKLNHLNPRNFILWFGDDLTPHVEKSRPASLATLQGARWAIGGIDLAEKGGPLPGVSGPIEKRTLLGLDTEHKKLWIGVFEAATQTDATQVLMRAGAQYVMTLDGGKSTSLYFGNRTHGIQSGLRVGGQCPVATVIGIKADPILDP